MATPRDLVLKNLSKLGLFVPIRSMPRHRFKNPVCGVGIQRTRMRLTVLLRRPCSFKDKLINNSTA